MRVVVLAALLMTGAPVLAQDYSQTCNENGYVIEALRGPFAAAPIYLGESCDVFHAQQGEGRWCWHNGGINLEMASGSWILSNLELYCEAPGLETTGCGC